MIAEILSIGSELTTGAKLDTNSQWLSQELGAIGIPVHFHTTVADDLEANVQALRIAVQRADLVLVTGGLGPTLDDLTRDALARLAGVPLELHQPSLEHIQEMFARRGRPMPERNVVQAMFPKGSEPVPNPRGTAPGVFMEVPRPQRPACRIFALPGVPSEMKAMFQDWLLPRLLGAAAGNVIRQRRIQCFGLGESAAEELLQDITARGRDPEVGITVHEATITLRIVAQATSAALANQKVEQTAALIRERMRDYVFGEEDEELEHVVVRLLNARRQTLATVEVATGGLLAHRLTDVRGHAECYRGGLLATGNHGEPLGLMASPADSREPVAPHPVAAWALNCRAQFATDFALAVGPCTLPSAGATGAPHIALALAEAHGVTAHELNVAGDPAILKSRVAKSALNLLRLRLLSSEFSNP